MAAPDLVFIDRNSAADSHDEQENDATSVQRANLMLHFGVDVEAFLCQILVIGSEQCIGRIVAVPGEGEW